MNVLPVVLLDPNPQFLREVSVCPRGHKAILFRLAKLLLEALKQMYMYRSISFVTSLRSEYTISYIHCLIKKNILCTVMYDTHGVWCLFYDCPVLFSCLVILTNSTTARLSYLVLICYLWYTSSSMYYIHCLHILFILILFRFIWC